MRKRRGRTEAEQVMKEMEGGSRELGGKTLGKCGNELRVNV